jgi:hypothetical protein
VFGRPVNDIAWRAVYRDYQRAKQAAQTNAMLDNTKLNTNAFARAYMESAAFHIRKRLNPELNYLHWKPKSKNPEGKTAGIDFAERADPTLFSAPPS